MRRWAMVSAEIEQFKERFSVTATTRSGGEQFARALRQILKLHHLPQVELAEELGVRQQTISRIVHGTVFPDEELFDRIAEYLRVRITEDQYEWLLELYVSARPEPAPDAAAARVGGDALEALFVAKFRNLIPHQQLEIMRRIEQMTRDNEEQMARNAGLEPPLSR